MYINGVDIKKLKTEVENGYTPSSATILELIQNTQDGLGGLLATKHTGAKISAHGVLGRIRDGRYYKELNFGCGEMLRHLEEMAERFYSGDVKAVDEFLQLYDLAGQRPETPNAKLTCERCASTASQVERRVGRVVEPHCSDGTNHFFGRSSSRI